MEKQEKKIVITGEKGGTGKSTVTALSIEYVNYLNKKTKLIDLDPLQISTSYVQNCWEEGRKVITDQKVDYQIVDTAGIVGASLNFINQADIIVVPFRAHYPDLKAILPWFQSLNSKIQKRIIFLPNFWRNTKEQREGLVQVKELVEKYHAKLITPLPDKPALLGTILNGGKENFFTKPLSQELIAIMSEIIN